MRSQEGVPRDLFYPGEDPGLDPLAAPFPDRGGRARAVGNRHIGAAKPQDLDQLLEDDLVLDPGQTSDYAAPGAKEIWSRKELDALAREFCPAVKFFPCVDRYCEGYSRSR
jgi:hypothetical protein